MGYLTDPELVPKEVNRALGSAATLPEADALITAATADALGISLSDVLRLTQAGVVKKTTLDKLQSLLAGNLTVGRNRIINGQCSIAQRAAISVASGNLSAFGGPDRYKAANGAGGAFSQSQNSMSFNGVLYTSVMQTVTTINTVFTGGNYWNGITQLIEGVNSYDLVGKTVTISFLFYTNVTGTYSVALSDSALSSCVSTFNAFAGQPISVTKTFSIPSTAVIPNTTAVGLLVRVGALSTGTYLTPAPDVWSSGTSYIAAPGVVNWAATVGNFIMLTNLQLEVGAVQTPFEKLDYTTELSRCQRYYHTPLTGAGMLTVSAVGNGTVACHLPHVCPMRIPPTVVNSLVEANYIANSPGANQWALLSLGVVYCTKTGAIAMGPYPGINYTTLSWSGMTLSSQPNAIQLGAGSYVNLSAEL